MPAFFPLKVLGRSEGKKRVLLFGKRKRSVQYAKYIFKALSKKGYSVLWVYVPERWLRGLRGVLGYAALKRVVKTFDPHIFIARSVTLDAGFLRGLKVPKVAIFPVPFTEKEVDRAFLEAAREYDLFFVNWVDDGTLKKLGINARFFMQGFDPDEHRPFHGRVEKFASQVSFIGKPYFRERIEFMKKVRDDFHLKLYGGDWDRFGMETSEKKVGPLEYAQICSSSDICLGYDIRTDLKYHFSIRLWLTLGCGGFYITNYVVGFEDVLKNHEHIVWYRDYEEFRELCIFYLRHGELREKIARKGREFAFRNRTYEHVVSDILRELSIS